MLELYTKIPSRTRKLPIVFFLTGLSHFLFRLLSQSHFLSLTLLNLSSHPPSLLSSLCQTLPFSPTRTFFLLPSFLSLSFWSVAFWWFAPGSRRVPGSGKHISIMDNTFSMKMGLNFVIFGQKILAWCSIVRQEGFCSNHCPKESSGWLGNNGCWVQITPDPWVILVSQWSLFFLTYISTKHKPRKIQPTILVLIEVTWCCIQDLWHSLVYWSG